MWLTFEEHGIGWLWVGLRWKEMGGRLIEPCIVGLWKNQLMALEAGRNNFLGCDRRHT